MFYLGQGATSHRNLRLDEPLFLSLPLKDANKPVRVTTPDGRPSSQNSALDARGVTFRYEATGQVREFIRWRGRQRYLRCLRRRPADRRIEPDLYRAATRRERSRTSRQRYHGRANPNQIRTLVNRARYGAEIWYPLICSVIGLMFLESFLARKFGRRG